MDRLTGLGFAALARALSFLSLAWQRRLGRWLGRLAWHLRTREARATLTNLELCFPHLDAGERVRLARASLEQTGQLLAEVGVVAHWSEPRWQALIRHVEGEELLGATGTPTPLLVLVPHFGNWEFLALYLGKRGITALYDPPRLRSLEPLIVTARSRSGATLLPIDARGLRRFFRAFQDRRPVALLPDQVPTRRAGVYVPFFGVPALTMTLAHRLIDRSHARVLLGAAVRCHDGFRIRFSTLPAELADPDPAVSAATMNRAIEALVMTDPVQYQWEYKRFKRPPPGRPNPYARR